MAEVNGERALLAVSLEVAADSEKTSQFRMNRLRPRPKKPLTKSYGTQRSGCSA